MIGLHFILAAIIAYIVRGNVLASAFGTIIGNPLTFPFIWGLTHQLGSNMLGLRNSAPPPDLEDVVEPSLTVLQLLWPGTLKPMLVGSIPLGLCCAIFVYVIVRGATAAYQKKRRDYLARKLAMQQAEQARRQDTSFEYSPTPNEPPA